MRNVRQKSVVCPRCGLKMPPGSPKCDDCGLIFERLSFASNKDAKRKIRRGDKDYIIMTKHLPKDVKYWKLILLVIFTGLMGGHYYYVGRYWKGAIFSLFFVFTTVCMVLSGVITTAYPGWMELIGALLIGPFGLFWLWDILSVILMKFKVPIAIDLQSQDIDDFLKEKK